MAENNFKYNIKSIINVLISIGFLAIIIFPTIQKYVPIVPVSESREKRKLADRPQLNIENRDQFPFAYENYYNDHFSLRNQLVRFKSNLAIHVFRQSPMPDKVIIGKNDWLYLVKDELDTYRGKLQLQEEELKKLANEVVRRRDYLDNRGIKMYFVIAPTKYTIYPEFLPAYVKRIRPLNRTDQVKQALLEAGIGVLDLRDSLKLAKEKHMLFYKTDNHWNNLGSFVAYRSILSEIRKDFPELPVLDWNDFTIEEHSRLGGNTADLMNLMMAFNDTEYNLQPNGIRKAQKMPDVGYPAPQYFGYKDQYEEVYSTGNDSLPDILFIRDSFGNALIPYLTESFNRSVCIFDAWNYTANEHIIENEKPDIVLYVVLESLWHGFMTGVEKSENKDAD
ncbi:MAG: hypothetical protein R2764_05250 [Bacteroidales bacterium]